MIPVEAPTSKVDDEDDESYKGDNSNEAEYKKLEIKPLMDDFDNESNYEALIRLGHNVKSRISATFSNGVELGSTPSPESYVTIAMDLEKVNGKLEVIEPETAVLDEFNTTNLYAYSASRHMGIKNFDLTELKDPIANLFSHSGDLYDASQVLPNLEFASLKEKGVGKATDLLLKVKKILTDLLPDIENPDCIIINSPINAGGTVSQALVEIQTPYGRVPLNDLSLGYQTMLAWSVDLALRMLWRNPDSEDPLSQPAVVIVDEIDLHLHPKWQRMVREFLVEHFPKTQFICTAHSPIMAQSSEKENLCVLSRAENEVYIENNPFIVQGWRIGQIVTNLFEISERSPEIEELEIKRRAILDKFNRTPEDDQELKRLDSELSRLPVAEKLEDQKLMDQIRMTAELLRSEGKLK